MANGPEIDAPADSGGSAWAIVPARGGSVGIPGKNVQEVGGRPLIARTVGAARAAASVARVFVSTDDARIAAAARGAGAEVIDRPAAIAGATASSEAALLHALDTLEAAGEAPPEFLVFLQCTSPFTRARDIDGTVAMLRAGADSALAVAPSHRMLWRSEGGVAVGVNHDAARPRLRRQDMAPEFVETGAVYAMRTAGFRASGNRFFGRTALYELPAERAMEIDDPDDLALARALAPRLDDTRPALPSPLAAIVFDFDGVMTDDRVIQHEDGSEAVVCSRSDGMGIARARGAGIRMMVLSKETNPVVARRAAKLRLECHQAIDAKGPALAAWIAGNGLDARGVVYVGNDVNDLPAFAEAGCRVAVADAHPDVRAAAHIILSARGGRGAVRELCELALRGCPPA